MVGPVGRATGALIPKLWSTAAPRVLNNQPETLGRLAAVIDGGTGAREPRLVIADVHMPNVGGLDALRWVRDNVALLDQEETQCLNGSGLLPGCCRVSSLP